MGAAFENKGQLDDAIYHYKQALKINKNLYPAWLNAGNACFKKEMYDEAVFFYSKALELKPNVSDVHCLIGISLGRTGNLKMALQAFENALTIAPNSTVALKNKRIAEELLNAEER